MRRIDPDLDSDQFIPTLYTAEHLIQQSEAQHEALTRRIAAARGYVGAMKHMRQMNTPQPTPRPMSFRQRLVRDYQQIVEHGWTAMFYVALAFCALILLVGVYSMLRD